MQLLQLRDHPVVTDGGLFPGPLPNAAVGLRLEVVTGGSEADGEVLARRDRRFALGHLPVDITTDPIRIDPTRGLLRRNGTNPRHGHWP